MIEYILYILLPLTVLSPIILMFIKQDESSNNIQKYVMGYHLFSFLILLITFLSSRQVEVNYGISISQNSFLVKSLALKVNKIILNFMIVLHVAGFIQSSLREKYISNVREIWCYFTFYFLVMVSMCSSNILTIVTIEEILLLILYLNYKVKDSLVTYDSRYFKLGNLLLMLGGLVYLIGIDNTGTSDEVFSAKSIASMLTVSGVIIKLHLFPFNRNKFTNYTLEMNKGIIEQQFLALLPTLAILTKLISDDAISSILIRTLFYFSLFTVLLTSISLIVQNNVKNISRLLMHSGICIFLLHLCTGNVTEALYSLMSHSLSYLGIVAFIGIISYKNKTKKLKEFKNVKLNHNLCSVFLYILLGSSMALPFSPLAFSHYNLILSSYNYNEADLIVSLMLNISLLILSFSMFRLFWYSSHFFKPEGKELIPSTIQVVTLGSLSMLLIIFVIIGIPNLFIESYDFSFKAILNSKYLSLAKISIQKKNLVLMYTFAHPFIAAMVIYIFYMKKNKKGKINDFKFKNITLFNLAEKNFSITRYLSEFLDIITTVCLFIKLNIIETSTRKIYIALGRSVYHGAGFLSNIRPKGINSNLLYAATTMAIMLVFLFSELI
jgi:formate hydrogenlyase subunit 3/multisubunit Na+/H+ antiporter MnhD subunit